MEAAEAPQQDDAGGAAGGETYAPAHELTEEAKARRREQRAMKAEKEAAGRRWGWTPDRMDDPAELLKAKRRAERAERAEELERSSEAQQERAYQRATQESDMRRDLTRRMMEPLTLLEIDAVTSGRRNRKGRAERNADGRMMGLDAFGHLSYDHFTDFQQAERLESLRNQHQVEEERTARREQPAGQRTRGNTRLFVSNLADNVDWKALMHHFEHIGPVAFCDVYMHRKGTPAVITNPDLEGKSKGCGVVQMEDVESAREALAVLNGSKLQNTVIIVQPDARATPEHLGAQARGKQPAKREQQAANADPTRLFVSKLAAGVTWADLKRHFSHIGAVPYCDVYMYRQGSKEVKANPELEGMSKMADVESAREALEVLNGSKLQGSYIVVQPDARAAPEYAEKLRAAPPDWPPPPPRVERRHLERSGPRPGRAAPGRRERAAKRNGVDGTRLFVTGLHEHVDWAALKDHFSHIGLVQYCDVYMFNNSSKFDERQLGKSKGCGVVQMADEASAAAAAESLNGSMLMGKRIAVRPDNRAPVFTPNTRDDGFDDDGYGGGGGRYDRTEMPAWRRRNDGWDNDGGYVSGGVGGWDDEFRGDRRGYGRENTRGGAYGGGGGGYYGGRDDDRGGGGYQRRGGREQGRGGMQRGGDRGDGWGDRDARSWSRGPGSREQRMEYVQKPGDWQCQACGAMCFASRQECFKCRAPR